MRRFWLNLVFAAPLLVAMGMPALADKTRGLSIQLRASEAKDAPVTGSVRLYTKSYALVVGINDYRGRAWGRLAKAEDDARKVQRALERKGFEVTPVFNPDSRSLKLAFEDFFIEKGRDPNARLFVWYAGHGHTVDGEGYLIPSDGVSPRDEIRFLRTALSLREFGRFVRLAKSKHVFTVFDSCFSGTIFDVARSSNTPPQITRITTEPVRQFLSSGDAGQKVSDDGTFADLFIEALEGRRRADPNADGYLTASELGAYLDSKMSNLTNNRQTPRYGKLSDKRCDKGDFVFALAKPRPSQASRNPPSTPQADKETVFWQSIQGSTDPADFEAYLETFPKGTFSALARVKIRKLKARRVAARTAPATRRRIQPSQPASMPRRPLGRSTERPNFPCSSAKLIVPWGAGGGTHVIAKMFEKSIRKLGVSPMLQVVTIPGQGGNKGAKVAARAEPDGCTLFVIHQSAITSYLNSRINFHFDNFETVSLLTSSPDIIAGANNVPWNNFNEFRRATIAAPGEITVGATFDSTSQFNWLFLEEQTGMQFRFVPYDGTRQRMTALLSGSIQMGGISVTAGRRYVASGELKAFAIAAERRSKFLPHIPTLKELGIDLVSALRRGIVAPKGTSRSRIMHWARVFKRAAEDPELRRWMNGKGIDVNWAGPDAYRAWASKTFAAYKRAAIKSGLWKR